MPLISDPADLIRMYLKDSGAAGMPGAIGQSMEKMKAAPFDPNFVPASMFAKPAALTDKDFERPKAPTPLMGLPRLDSSLPLKVPEARIEEEPMFKSPTGSLGDIARDEAARRAAAEQEKAKAALAAANAAQVASRTAPATTTPAKPDDPNAKPGGSFQAQDPTKFAEMMLPHVTEALKGTGLDPRLVIAQAALETGYGGAAPGFNYFGIKSHGRPGGQELDTHEVIDGKTVKRKESFRTYKDAAESVRDYVKFLQENSRYAGVLSAKTLEEQIAAMGKSGYATDPNYAAKLLAIAQKIKLQQAQPQAGPVTAGGSPYDPNAQPPAFMQPPPEPDTRARGGHIRDLLALSRSYQ